MLPFHIDTHLCFTKCNLAQKKKSLELSRTEVKTKSEIPSRLSAKTWDQNSTHPLHGLEQGGGTATPEAEHKRPVCSLPLKTHCFEGQHSIPQTHNEQATLIHILENWFDSLSHLRGTSPYVQYFDTIQAIKSKCSIKRSSPIAAIALEAAMGGGCVWVCFGLVCSHLWKYFYSGISSTMKCHFTINSRVRGITSLS